MPITDGRKMKDELSNISDDSAIQLRVFFKFLPIFRQTDIQM